MDANFFPTMLRVAGCNACSRVTEQREVLFCNGEDRWAAGWRCDDCGTTVPHHEGHGDALNIPHMIHPGLLIPDVYEARRPQAGPDLPFGNK